MEEPKQPPPPDYSRFKATETTGLIGDSFYKDEFPTSIIPPRFKPSAAQIAERVADMNQIVDKYNINRRQVVDDIKAYVDSGNSVIKAFSVVVKDLLQANTMGPPVKGNKYSRKQRTDALKIVSFIYNQDKYKNLNAYELYIENHIKAERRKELNKELKKKIFGESRKTASNEQIQNRENYRQYLYDKTVLARKAAQPNKFALNPLIRPAKNPKGIARSYRYKPGEEIEYPYTKTVL
jgi:hypothetical protein